MWTLRYNAGADISSRGDKKGEMDVNSGSVETIWGQEIDSELFQKQVTDELDAIAGGIQKSLIEESKTVSVMIPAVLEAATHLSKNLLQHRSAIIREHEDVKRREDWFDAEKDRVFMGLVQRR